MQVPLQFDVIVMKEHVLITFWVQLLELTTPWVYITALAVIRSPTVKQVIMFRKQLTITMATASKENMTWVKNNLNDFGLSVSSVLDYSDTQNEFRLIKRSFCVSRSDAVPFCNPTLWFMMMCFDSFDFNQLFVITNGLFKAAPLTATTALFFFWGGGPYKMFKPTLKQASCHRYTNTFEP